MRAVSAQKRVALEAVARYFSAAWQEGAGAHEAYLTFARKRIAVEVATISGKRGRSVTKPRLRFDKVALRLVRDLRAGLIDAVPDGQTVILAITAPIRLASKTAAFLEDKIRAFLTGRSAQDEFMGTIHGNRFRIRVMKGSPSQASKFIGFVHNPDSDPTVLFDVTHALLAAIGPHVRIRRPARFAGDRWLVITCEDGFPHIETYRHVYSQLAIPASFRQVLMVFPGGRVETLNA